MHKLARIVGLAAGALLFTFPGVSDASHWPSAYDHWQMDEGNFWLLHTVEDKSEHRVDFVEVTESGYYGGGWYSSHVDGLLIGDDTPVWDHVNSLAMWTHDGERWSTLFDFGAAIGESWPLRVDACDAYTVTRAPGFTVDAPAGLFSDPQQFSLAHTPDANVKCAGEPVQTVSFAREVGVVHLDRPSSTSALMFARVAGEIVAQAPGETREDDAGVSYTLMLVDDALQQPPPIQCLVAPCPARAATLRFAVMIENTSGAAVELPWLSTQRVELDLFDDEGVNVASWSDDRLFGQGGYVQSLQPGERVVFFRELPLVNTKDGPARGQPLVGEFEVVAFPVVSAPKLWTLLSVAPPY